MGMCLYDVFVIVFFFPFSCFSIQMNTFISTCMYIRIRTYVCSAHTYVCSAHTYVCMYCTYIHVIISFHTKFLIPTQILMNVLCMTTVIVWVTTATASTQWAVTSVYVNQDTF